MNGTMIEARSLPGRPPICRRALAFDEAQMDKLTYAGLKGMGAAKSCRT